MMTDRYRITTGITHAEIEVSKGVVVQTPPRFSHLFGRLFINVQEWARKSGATIEKVDP